MESMASRASKGVALNSQIVAARFGNNIRIIRISVSHTAAENIVFNNDILRCIFDLYSERFYLVILHGDRRCVTSDPKHGLRTVETDYRQAAFLFNSVRLITVLNAPAPVYDIDFTIKCRTLFRNERYRLCAVERKC